jgi:hypothetical protein
MSENYQVSQGSSLTIDVEMRDSDSEPVTDYTGSEDLVCSVWPGDARGVTFSPVAEWTTVSPDPNVISITITDEQTANVEPGRYQLLLKIDDAGEIVDAFACTVTVTLVAGVGVAPRTYTSYDDLLRYGRSWLKQLQTSDDQLGFAEQQGRARTKLEDIAHAHYRGGSLATYVGGYSGGPRIWPGRSAWLQEQLDAGYLMVTDQVKELCAKFALAEVCRGQIGTGDSASAYARLARMYESEANYLASCLIIGIDSNSDGVAETTIDCTFVNASYS